MSGRVKNQLGGRKKAKAAGGIFNPRILFAMIILGVFSFGAYIVLSGFAGDLRSSDNGGAHALSRSATGYGGLLTVLKQNYSEADVTTESVMRGENRYKVRIVTPAYGGSDTFKELRLRTASLVILPKWRTKALPSHKGWVQKLNTPYPDKFSTSMLENLLEPLAEDASMFRSKLDNMKVMINGAPDYGLEPQMFYNFEHIQTLSGSAFEPIIVSDYGTVLGKVPGEDIYVLSDPDFVNTRAMGKADIARFGHKITQIVETETGSGGFVFDLTLHGFSGSRNLIKLALTPPFLGATLCLLAMGLLIAWQAFMRFGAPRRQGRPLALGKFSLVQNAANLIKLAGREPKMAKGYAALTRKLVAEDLHIPSGIGDTELNKRLDLYCRKKQAKSEWSKITIYQRETDNNQDLMHAARELYEWRGDMTHDGK